MVGFSPRSASQNNATWTFEDEEELKKLYEEYKESHGRLRNFKSFNPFTPGVKP